jgi:hypothetical protein
MKLISRNGKLLSRNGKAIGRVEAVQVQWDYEGVMTVGDDDGVLGWSDGFFGSMDPSTGIQVDGYGETVQIFSIGNELYIEDSNGNISANFIEIDGIEYELTGDPTDIGTDPFINKVGEQVTIKLR